MHGNLERRTRCGQPLLKDRVLDALAGSSERRPVPVGVIVARTRMTPVQVRNCLAALRMFDQLVGFAGYRKGYFLLPQYGQTGGGFSDQNPES